MINFKALQKRVVDRAGFTYCSQVNHLRWRTAHFPTTEVCGVPPSLANLNGPRSCSNSNPALTTNAKDRDHG